MRSNDEQAGYFGKERGRGQNRRGSGCSTTPGQLGSLETTDCRPVASIDSRNPTVHNTEPRAWSCRRAAPRHYAPLRSVPLRAGSPGHISRCTGQDPIAHTRVRHLTVPDSRWNVGWITDRGKGQQVQGERVALLVLSPFRCVKRDRSVDRIRSRFTERKDSQRDRCLAHRAFVAPFRYEIRISNKLNFRISVPEKIFTAFVSVRRRRIVS